MCSLSDTSTVWATLGSSHLAPRVSVQQLRGLTLHLLALQRPGEALRVDSDGERPHTGQHAVVLHACAACTRVQEIIRKNFRHRKKKALPNTNAFDLE